MLLGTLPDTGERWASRWAYFLFAFQPKLQTHSYDCTIEAVTITSTIFGGSLL